MEEKNNIENEEVKAAAEGVAEATESANPAEAEPQNSVEDTIAALEAKCQKQHDEYLRLYAEFDNYRKRTLKEKSELIKSGGENVIVGLLPLLDDFERALKSMEDAYSVSAVKEGVDLIYNKFQTFLQSQGVKAIDTEGQVFDTEFHEAITTIPVPNEDMKGKVVDCTQKGYTLNEKVIRYAKVVVGGWFGLYVSDF